MERLLFRKVELWLVLLLALLGILAAIMLAHMAATEASGSTRFGVAGRAAAQLARWPGSVGQTVVALRDTVTGDIVDQDFRVARDPRLSGEGFAPVASTTGIRVDGLQVRGERGAMTEGWRFVLGTFRLDAEVRHAALLLDPALAVARIWPLTEDGIPGISPRPPFRKFPHGVDVLPDGSLIFNYDGGRSIQRIDACGKRIWARPGGWHHAVTLAAEGDAAWSFRGETMLKLSAETGETLARFDLAALIDANPDIDILQMRRRHWFPDEARFNTPGFRGGWLADPTHFNDIDPLPAALADRFPGFEAGDLAISARSANLVFVVDPDTLEIKWWRAGAVERQHDPDWRADGTISVFNNRMSRAHSDIVAIDPATFAVTETLDGAEHGFFTRIRGKHQWLDNGHLVVTSAQQGWGFEVAPDGRRVMELLNLAPGGAAIYTIADLRVLPATFAPETWPDCP